MITDSRLDQAAALIEEACTVVFELEDELSIERNPHELINLMRARKLLAAGLSALKVTGNGGGGA